MLEPFPVVTRIGLMDLQVCVPSDWTDQQILDFAKAQGLNTSDPSIRKEGDRLLQGAPERNPCADRVGFVHVMIHY